MLRQSIVANIIETRVGAKGTVAHRVAAIVLENGVEFLHDGILVKVVQRVRIPNDVHVLKQEIIAKHGYELDANYFGHHHGNKSSVAIALGSFGWNIAKVLSDNNERDVSVSVRMYAIEKRACRAALQKSQANSSRA